MQVNLVQFSFKEHIQICQTFLLCNDTVLDNKTIKGYHYQGFPLNNFGDTNIYSTVTVEECQFLCEITPLCRYFNYGNSDETCYLKFGVGKKVPKDGSFGYKYSSGIRRVITQI